MEKDRDVKFDFCHFWMTNVSAEEEDDGDDDDDDHFCHFKLQKEWFIPRWVRPTATDC